MPNYKVIALSVGGKGNKIFNSGDIVTELNFPEGNAAKLVEEGFLELIPSEETPEPTVELPATEIKVDEVPVAPEAENKAEETPEPTVETKPETKKKK